jgi:hypothetical protein
MVGGNVVVLVGASNLSMGMPTACALARQMLGPSTILAACGVGRSYVRSANLFGMRRLPAVHQSGLSEAVRAASRQPLLEEEGEQDQLRRIRVLLMDVGNDIGYGRSPLEILSAVERTIAQIRVAALDTHERVDLRVVLADLPPSRVIGAVPTWKFLLMKNLLFPRSPLSSMDDVVQRVEEVREGLVALPGVDEFVSLDESVYGMDPLHFKKRCRLEAFSTLLAPWSDGDQLHANDSLVLERTGDVEFGAASLEKFGRLVTNPQPHAKFGDGSELSLF